MSFTHLMSAAARRERREVLASRLPFVESTCTWTVVSVDGCAEESTGKCLSFPGGSVGSR